MISSIVGEDVFLKGVTLYLNAHLYGNAKSADLWKGIEGACHGKIDIAGLTKNWTEKIGFPVLTVEEKENGIRVRQNRFLSTGDPTVRWFTLLYYPLHNADASHSTKPEEDQTIWHVPLQLRVIDSTGKSSIDLTILTEREINITIPNVLSASFKLNTDTIGVYRVLYTKERLAKLGAEAGKKDSQFSIDDR